MMTRFTGLRYFFLLVAAFAIQQASPAYAEAQKIGVVGAIDGNVSAKAEDGTVRALAAGDDVFLNDTISSATGSKAQIMFLDKSSLMINPDSTVTVDKFVFNPATSTGDLTIQNTKGALRFIGGALSKEKPVTIKTPVATIGIRGGIADTHVASGGATDAIFVYGEEMTMTNASGQTASVTVPGQGLGLDSPTDMPVQLPPERVMQHLNSFSMGDNPAGADDRAGNADGQEPQEPQEKHDGNAPRSEDDANNDNEQHREPGDKQAPSDGRDPNVNGNEGDPMNPPPPHTGLSDPQYNDGGLVGGSQPPLMQDGMVNDPLMPPPPPGSIGFFPDQQTGFYAPPPPIVDVSVINNTNLLTTSSQQTTQQTNTDSLTQTATNPDKFGAYRMGQQGNPTILQKGGAEFQTIGSRQNGLLRESSGAVHTASLPWLQNSGYYGGSSSDLIVVDGRGYTGKAFLSPDLAMTYYQLQEAGGSKNIGMVFGNTIAASNWSSAISASAASADHRLVFYDFLPDLHQHESVTFGFFDYNIADPRLAPYISSAQIGNLGMAIDWTGQRYLTGHFIWNNAGASSSTPLQRELILSFGNTMRNGNLLDGNAYEFATAYNSSGWSSGMNAGFVRSLTAYGASATSPFGGLLLEGIEPDDETLTSTQAFGNNVSGEYLAQPLVVNDSVSDPTGGSRTSLTMKGFAAGYMITDTQSAGGGMTRNFTRYGNDNAGQVEITTNATTNNVAATFRLEDMDDNSGPVSFMEAKFGATSGSTADSAFMGDGLYAAQQNTMKFGEGATTTSTYSGNDVADSAIVAANYIADTTASCTTCEYVHWGVWAGDLDTGTNVDSIVPLMPYVAGEITQNLSSVSALSLGSVNYSGVMYGHVLDGSALTRSTGSFTAGINLNTRQLTSYNGQFAGMNFGFSGATYSIPGAGTAEFNNISVHNLGAGSPGNVQGYINGALFGPQAEDIAGNFAVNNTVTGAEAAGVYLGSRP